MWPPPTIQPASSWISLHRLIPFVTITVGHRPVEISPVSSFTFTTTHSPCAGGFFIVAFKGSSLLPLALTDLRAACYNVSAHLVTQMHWLPATWPPVRYQDWTSTNKQTMTFQDTPQIPACRFSAPDSSEILASVKVCHTNSGYPVHPVTSFWASSNIRFHDPK
jgi:hypothetical protein